MSSTSLSSLYRVCLCATCGIRYLELRIPNQRWCYTCWHDIENARREEQAKQEKEAKEVKEEAKEMPRGCIA